MDKLIKRKVYNMIMRNHIMSNTKIILIISCSYNFDNDVKLEITIFYLKTIFFYFINHYIILF
jgi:hypothetical protein